VRCPPVAIRGLAQGNIVLDWDFPTESPGWIEIRQIATQSCLSPAEAGLKRKIFGEYVGRPHDPQPSCGEGNFMAVGVFSTRLQIPWGSTNPVVNT
jgi:hypothetical protein